MEEVEAIEENSFNAETMLTALNSLSGEVGTDPVLNIEAILRRTCMALECRCAAYARTESGTGNVYISRAYNLSPSLSTLWKIATEVCRRIIAEPNQEPVWTFYFPDSSENPSALIPGECEPRSGIGYAIQLNGQKLAVVAVLDPRPRRFNEAERLWVIIAGMLMGFEELRCQKVETSENWQKICQYLTPTEAKVAALVREGLANKEIAGALRLTVRAVEFHRYNIRKRLGLRKTKFNLRQYLGSNSQPASFSPPSESSRD
jgi:hypothetical protein